MNTLYLFIAIGAMAAGFVQGLSGFAFSMVAMSVWVWAIDPRLASVLAVFGALSGQVLAALTVRRGFDRKLIFPFVLGGLAGIPLGVVLLPLLDPLLFKALLGLILMVWCPAMLCMRSLPRIESGSRIGDAIAGAIGGIMSGLGGLVGVAPTLWCTLRGFDKDVQRAVIQNFNLAMLAVTMAGYIATGLVTRAMLPLFAIVLPAMLIPTLIGTRLYHQITPSTFRKVVLGLLSLAGLALCSASLPGLIAR